MQVKHGGPNQPSLKANIGFAVFIFLAGCIWPLMVHGDFLDEADAHSWDTVDATVVYLQIIYDICDDGIDGGGDGTCGEYIASYRLEFSVNNESFTVSERETVSHYTSRVWEVDYPLNSTREIAYDDAEPSNIDIDQGNYVRFIPPILVALLCTLFAALLAYASIMMAFGTQPKPSKKKESDIPLFDEPIHFISTKSVWGELHFTHPSVEALAKKMKSFACTAAEIAEFFSKCETLQEDSKNNIAFDREWILKYEQFTEEYDSELRIFANQNRKIRRVLVSISAFMLLVTLLLGVPMFTKYGALAWYGWVLILSTLASFGFTFLFSSITGIVDETIEQGLSAAMIEILEEEEEEEDS
ncbi:MAG: hypothetical protein QMC44_04435 [Candidatus Poseidoniaceae archaeon]|jgi:hypothetical protein